MDSLKWLGYCDRAIPLNYMNNSRNSLIGFSVFETGDKMKSVVMVVWVSNCNFRPHSLFDLNRIRKILN